MKMQYQEKKTMESIAAEFDLKCVGEKVTCPAHATLVNLTPHPVVLRGEVGDVTVSPSGTVARVASAPGQPVALEAGLCPVPVHAAPSWGEVEDLPAPSPGVVFIVSAMVAARCVDRGDVVSPGTGPADGAIRDDAGRIVAVTRLVQAPAVAVAPTIASIRVTPADGRREALADAIGERLGAEFGGIEVEL